MKINFYPVPDNLIAGITMRDPGEPEENNMALHACKHTESIKQNRSKLAAMLNCGLEDFVCAYQCHSANFHEVVIENRGKGAVTMDTAILNTDALYTFEPDLLLCCFTADCVPLILYDETAGLIGVVHSGWQGTVKEITPNLLEHLILAEKCNPKNIHIFIGPAISPEKFEVDRDVCDRFLALGYSDEFISFNEKTGKFHIDNQLTVKRQCEHKGIPAENIVVDKTCTFTSRDCFSYRKDKNCGRHMSFIIKKQTEDTLGL